MRRDFQGYFVLKLSEQCTLYFRVVLVCHSGALGLAWLGLAWLAGWLVGWLVGLLVCWLACLFVCLLVCMLVCLVLVFVC